MISSGLSTSLTWLNDFPSVQIQEQLFWISCAVPPNLQSHNDCSRSEDAFNSFRSLMLEIEGDPELTEPLPAVHLSTEARIFPIICMGKGILANITINYVLFSFFIWKHNTSPTISHKCMVSTTSLTHRSGDVWSLESCMVRSHNGQHTYVDTVQVWCHWAQQRRHLYCRLHKLHSQGGRFDLCLVSGNDGDRPSTGFAGIWHKSHILS